MGALVILAAGSSSRMGEPKALLPWKGGQTFLDSVMTAAAAAPVARRAVVTRADLAAALRERLHPGWELWINPDPERGMLSSLQTALRQLSPDVPWLMVALVDQPGLSPSTFARIAADATPHERVCPAHGGRQGHPVALGRDCFARLLEAPPEGNPRELLEDFPRRRVEVEDPHSVTDFDTPQQLRAFRERPF